MVEVNLNEMSQNGRVLVEKNERNCCVLKNIRSEIHSHLFTALIVKYELVEGEGKTEKLVHPCFLLSEVYKLSDNRSIAHI